MKHPSIRVRLLLGTASVSALLLVVVSFWLYSKVEKSLKSHFDSLLDEKISLVMSEIQATDSQVIHQWHVALVNDESRCGRTLIQVWDKASGSTMRSPNLGEQNLERRHGALGEKIYFHTVLPDGREGRAVGILTDTVIPQVIICAQDDEEFHEILEETKRAFLIESAALILLLALIIWWGVGRLLKPLANVCEELSSRKIHEIGKPLEITQDYPTELRGMAETFNSLLERVNGVRAKERDFFLNLAHEVRTPVAGFNAILEQALRSPREGADYQKRIREALGIGENLGRLVNRLLEFGRLNHDLSKSQLRPCKINTLARNSWKIISSKAASKSLSARWNLCESGAPLNSDPDLLQVVLLNLIENAVSYAKPNSTIALKTVNSGGQISFSIKNIVLGEMPNKAETSLFFESFYRQDKARGREDGHAGLGLSFTQEILNALHGKIAVETHSDDEIEFIVTFTHNNLTTADT